MRCRDLQRLANPAYLRGFLFPGLLRFAPYCVPGGVRVVSNGTDSLGLELGPVALQGDPAPALAVLLALYSKTPLVDLIALSHAGVVRAVGGLTLLSS
jgi:hypothetical protein